MLKPPTFSAGSSSFGQRTEDTTIETPGSFMTVNNLPGTRFSQHGHELKVYNTSRGSMNFDSKYLMMQKG